MRIKDTTQPRPLAGMTVLDLTTALAGPYATLLLAGLGARVIKIENPRSPDTARNNAPFVGRDGVAMVRRHEDDMSLAIMERARNKESITLNLKDPRGRELFERLVQQADAVVENFSAGTADRLGVGYTRCAELNPRIVYTSISGFGANMVSRQNRAMDTIVQALSGLMMTSGEADAPPLRVGVPFGDLTAPLFAVIGTLAALIQARTTGQGQHVDVSLLGAITALVAAEPFEVMQRTGQATRTGNTMPRLAPFGIFPTQDGHIAICAPTDGFTTSLFEAMGCPELAQDTRFVSRDQRVQNHEGLHALIEAWTRSLSTDEAVERLERAEVPSGRVRDPGQAVRDPRLLARGETEVIEHPTYGAVEDIIVGGLPIRMTGAFAGFDKPAPGLGQHNADVFSQFLGLDAGAIARLRAEGVV
ncbi:CaiB/BaiF CoA transferase family protein [Roseateles paludis]|uniref:CoA transferase n=1 Tax=Roseateles paludis TaxID=3145238 RepID=A0ABV0G592_9BURK